MIFEKDNLIIVLNELYFGGKRVLKVRYPAIGELFRIDLEKGRIDLMSREEYEKRWNRVINDFPMLGEEIPKYRHYLKVFQISGILKPRNWDYIKEKFLKAIDRNPLRGDRALFIGFDTDVLVNRFSSVILKDVEKEKFGICLNKGVSDELHPKWDVKIDRNLNNLLKRVAREFNFINQPILSAREFKLGAIEYRKLKRDYYYKEIESESGDRKIIKEYKKFCDDNRVDLLIFSSDNNFVERVNEIGEGMRGIRIDQSEGLSGTACAKWEEIIELLYCTAIIYGFISFSGVKLYGIWAGKKGEHWNGESIKAEFESDKLGEEIERDLNILSL